MDVHVSVEYVDDINRKFTFIEAMTFVVSLDN